MPSIDAVYAKANDPDRIVGISEMFGRYGLLEMKFEQRIRAPFDPIAALESLGLDDAETARLQPEIDQFVVSMDHALRTWQRGHIGGLRRRSAIPHEAPGGNERLQAITENWMSLIAGVVWAGDNARMRIADALDLEHREAFLIGIDRQVYPEAFECCPAELFADALRFTPDTAPEKRAAIEAIYADHVPRRDFVPG